MALFKGIKPYVFEVDDYHDIAYRAEIISDFTGVKWKHKELGFVASCYTGLLYVGKLPPKEEIVKLLMAKFKDLNTKQAGRVAMGAAALDYD
jgi:hypothetical protein